MRYLYFIEENNVLELGGIADNGTFAYDGTYWNLVAVDRSCQEMTDTEVTDMIAALT